MEPGFKAYLNNRCQDRSNPMTLAELQNISTKLTLLDLLLASREDEDWTKMSKEFLLKKTSFVGHRYVEDLLDLMSKKENFDNFVSFSAESWSFCPNSHLFSSAFKSSNCVTCSNLNQ